MAYDPNDPDTKTALKAAVDAAIAETTAGLVEKNKELLAKLKRATKDAAIDPAEHQALQADIEQAQAKLAEMTKALKTATEEVEKNKKAYEIESQVTHRLLVDNGLNDALIKAGVKPEMIKAVKAMLASQVTLKADGESRVAVVGDKPLHDFVTEWAKSDEGKHFVVAPSNQGGGAAGGGGNQQSTKSWKDMTLDERTQIYKTDPIKAQALQKGA